MEEAFSCILANLFHADVLNAPFVYSRSSNAYAIERQRYGYEFYTYRMIIRLVDAMYELGLVQGVKGRKDENGRCLTSKLWATERHLSSYFRKINAVFVKPNDEVLFLKDADKRPIDIEENDLTCSLRDQILNLNEMLAPSRLPSSLIMSNWLIDPKVV